jgi:hypothetical protein
MHRRRLRVGCLGRVELRVVVEDRAVVVVMATMGRV